MVRLCFENVREDANHDFLPPIQATYVKQVFDLLRIGPSGDVIAMINQDGLWELTEHVDNINPRGEGQASLKGKTFDSFTITPIF